MTMRYGVQRRNELEVNRAAETLSENGAWSSHLKNPMLAVNA